MQTYQKGFDIRPALPRYVATWDVTKVFNFIKSKPTLENCDLKALSHRLAILLCLTMGQREQTIKCLNLDCIKISSDKVVLFRAWNFENHQARLSFTTYRTKDSELCVVAHLKKYIKMIAPFTNTSKNQLLLSFIQAQKPI